MKKHFITVGQTYTYTYTALEGKDYVTKQEKILCTKENFEALDFLAANDQEVRYARDEDKKYADHNYLKAKEESDNLDTDPDLVFFVERRDVFDQAFPEEVVEDELVLKVREWIHSLPESQQRLVWRHLGENELLETLRREEVEETGRQITRQAYHNRWKKILDKFAKFMGVTPP